MGGLHDRIGQVPMNPILFSRRHGIREIPVPCMVYTADGWWWMGEVRLRSTDWVRGLDVLGWMYWDGMGWDVACGYAS